MPIESYPPTSTFGQRIADLQAEKERVAQCVVERFLGEGTSVFIGDGSSTFFVALEMFEREMQATIWTNHLAIAHEYALQASSGSSLDRMEMSLAGGQIDRDLMMTYGRRAAMDVGRWVEEAQCVVLSVRSIFSERGPAGLEQWSLIIKRRAMEAARRSGAAIVLVADKNKFPDVYRNEPLVFPRRNESVELFESANFFIVTNGSTDDGFQEVIEELQIPMGSRLIVI